MFRVAAIVLLSACLLHGAAAPGAEKPSKWRKIGSVITGDSKKGQAIRFALGFAATAGVMSLRPGGGPVPRMAAAPAGPVITAGTTQFGCGGCVGPDWSNGKP